jgi:hypothetical protein
MTRQWKRQTPDEIGRWVELDLMYCGNVDRLAQATGYTQTSVRRWLKAARAFQAQAEVEDDNA